MRRVERGPYPTALMQSPLRQTVGVVLTLGAVMFAFSGLQSLIIPGPWLRLGYAFLILTGICTLLGRLTLGLLTRRNPHLLLALVPTVIAGALSLWLVTARFGGATGAFQPKLSGSDFMHLGGLASSAQKITAQHVAPIEPYEPIIFIAIAGAILVYLLADLLGNAVRIPALVGITILPLWLPHLMLVPDVSIVEPLGTCLCLLALIAADNPFSIPHRRPTPMNAGFMTSPWQWLRLRTPEVARMLTAVTTVTIGVLLAAWTVPSLPLWEQVTAPSALQDSSGMKISNSLDLSASLEKRSNEVAFSYEWDGPPEDLGPLRTATLTEFSDGFWSPATPDSRTPRPQLNDEKIWPFTVPDADSSGTLTLTIDEFQDTSLPIPDEPRALLTDIGATYDAAQDVVELDSPTKQDQQFIVEKYSRELSADQLRNPGDGPLLDLPQWYGEVALSPALNIPKTEHIDQVRALAEEVTADAPSAYAKALALQSFFRDSEEFTYSFDVAPPQTGDAAWDFLNDRSGYCVQFSSTMTIMARSLGLPSRIGVGFLPGELSGANEYTVRGRDAHAWTEIFFDNVGWVRFDPTPAVQSGSAPAWAPDPNDPATEPPGEPAVEPTAEPVTTAPTPDPDPTTTSDPSTGPTVADSPLVASEGFAATDSRVLLTAGFVALIIVALVTFVIRRKRSTSGTEGAWQRVLEHASSAGFTIDPAATLRQIADDLEPNNTGDSLPEGDLAEGPIHELALLVERDRYSTADQRSTVTQEHLDFIVQKACSDLSALAKVSKR